MALGDIFQVRIFTRFGSQLGLMIRQYRITAETAGGVTPQEIAVVMDGAYGVPVRATLSSSANYLGVDVQRLRPLPPTVVAIGSAGAAAGLVPGDPLPRQCSGLITLRTNFAGRRFRGRAYVPFPGETDNTSLSAPSAAYVVNLGSISTVMNGPISVTGVAGTAIMNGVIWNRTTLTDTLITTNIPRTEWATQRRRGAFGRPNT